MQTSLIMQVLGVAEVAAIAAAAWNGRGDKHTADQVATEAMRTAFNDINFSGRIVIGEGERDEAPMLYIGEELGKGGVEIDIAVDPLEGTNLCAYNRPNALTTIAIAPKGALLFAPDTYMRKIAAGAQSVGHVHIDAPPAQNVRAVADALGKPISEVNVCILLRDRHKELIAAVRDTGARIRLGHHCPIWRHSHRRSGHRHRPVSGLRRCTRGCAGGGRPKSDRRHFHGAPGLRPRPAWRRKTRARPKNCRPRPRCTFNH